jgi:hypothetical protein
LRTLAYLAEIPRIVIRNNGIVEVTGSIPVGSTNKVKGLAGAGPFCILRESALARFSAVLRYLTFG